MHKIFFTTATLVVFLLFPLSFLSADSDSEERAKVPLLQQLHAIERYIAHTFSPDFESTKPVSDEVLRTSIDAGVDWLIHAQEENGHFAYEYLPFEDSYANDDNIVRQTGALFILAEVVRGDTKGDTKTNTAIEKAIAYFESLSPEHMYEDTEVRCITKSESSKICKLGATSLALTALLGYVEVYPEKAKEYEDLIEGYVSFIKAAKKNGSGFRDQYTVGTGFKGETESSFSNGEALLALVRYYQYDQNKDVKDMIDETFEYLRPQAFDTALYLWIMAALKDMHVLWPNEAYVSYTKDFTQWRIKGMHSARGTQHNYCAAAEGLVSAYSVLEGNSSDADQQKLRKEIDFWNNKNLSLQIQEEDVLVLTKEDGTFVFKKVTDMKQSRGGFLTGHDMPTQRIDFTQHCLSTQLQTLVDING